MDCNHKLHGSHEFVDWFVSLGGCMLCQFTWQYQWCGCLDFSGAQCLFLCVLGASACLGGDSLKDILNKAVQHLHCPLGDTNFWVHLLQHFIDVDVVRFFVLSSVCAWCGFSFCGHDDLILGDWWIGIEFKIWLIAWFWFLLLFEIRFLNTLYGIEP